MNSKAPVFIGIAVAAITLGAMLYLTTSREPESPLAEPPPAAPPAPRADAPIPPEPPREPDPVPPPAAPRAPRTPPAPEPAPAAPAAPTKASLTLETDVPGATVFLDREYVGTTPLTLENLDPGSRRLQLSAEGYDGISRTVDLAAGTNTVMLRFREVRLDKRMPVTHRHGMGSCEGTLVATVDGVSYQTSNKGDAFTLTYAQLETFAIDYMEKNLRVKQRGGKTWNFTQRDAANADELFVFHRDVEAARQKLAQGYAPVKP